MSTSSSISPVFDPTIRNIVILINDVSPAQYDQIWFLDNSIINHDEFKPNSIFNENICQITTDDFTMIILQRQILFTFQNNNWEKSLNKLNAFIQKINYENASVIGCNFMYFAPISNDKDENLSRQFFFDKENLLFSKYFNSSDSRFGVYMSKDYEQYRLKLDIKPTTVIKKDKDKANKELSEERILYSFNFHSDLGDDKLTEIQSVISDWVNIEKYSIDMLNAFYDQKLNNG